MSEEKKISTAERIYQLRKGMNKSQGEIADMLGVSRQSVSKWENGTSNPEIENLIELSKIFGVKVDDIINYRQGDEHKYNIVNGQVNVNTNKTAGIVTLVSGLFFAILGLVMLGPLVMCLGVLVSMVGICLLTFKKGDYIRNAWILYALFYACASWFGMGSIFAPIMLIATNFSGIYSQYIGPMQIQFIVGVVIMLSFIAMSSITIVKSKGAQSVINRCIFVFFTYSIAQSTVFIKVPFTGGPIFFQSSIWLMLAMYLAFIILYLVCAKKGILGGRGNVICLIAVEAVCLCQLGLIVSSFITSISNGAVNCSAIAMTTINFIINCCIMIVGYIFIKKQKSLLEQKN